MALPRIDVAKGREGEGSPDRLYYDSGMNGKLRRRLYRALVALTETGDSDSSPWPRFQQDPIRVQLVQRRRSSLGGKSSKASSDKNRVQDGAGHRSTPSPARRGLPATLNRDPPSKKVRSPSPAASRLWEGRDLSSLGEEM